MCKDRKANGERIKWKIKVIRNILCMEKSYWSFRIKRENIRISEKWKTCTYVEENMSIKKKKKRTNKEGKYGKEERYEEGQGGKEG